MGKIWIVFKREYLERVRSPWFLVATLFGPIFFAGIMVVPGLMAVRSVRDARVGAVHIVDATGTELGASVQRRLIAMIRQQDSTVTPEITLESITPDSLSAVDERLVSRVMKEEISGFLVLDSLTIAGISARYSGRNAASMGENERVEAAIRAAVLQQRAELAGVDDSVAEALTRARPQLRTERITEKGRGGSGLAAMIFGMVIAVLLYMMIAIYGQNILRGVLEEKTTRVAEVIIASIKPEHLLAGKVLGVGAVGLTQQLIWLASTVLFWTQRAKLMGAMGAPVPASFPIPSIEPLVLVALVLFFIFGYTLYASLFAAVGAMVGSQEEVQQASMPVMILLISSIIFVQPVMLNPTGTLAVVMSRMPFSAPVIMPLRMSMVQLSWVEIVGSLLGVALTCVAAIWVSARIYRVGLLMYGKRPSPRELLRWIRQS